MENWSINVENWPIAVFATWLFFGAAFWVDCGRHTGWPTQWKSRSRDAGWGEFVSIYLLICLIGGPLWWVVFFVYRRRP